MVSPPTILAPMSLRIEIRHSGYQGSNLLFDFPACDGPSRDHAHFTTVWLACSILINNKQDHWLSTSATGEPKVSATSDGLLPAGEYYLHVPDEGADTNEPFPIVPNFRSWHFPHRNMPSLWRAASQNDGSGVWHSGLPLTSTALESCRVTKKTLEVDDAHIIPVQEKPWFALNEMGKYAGISSRSGETVADGSLNKIGLRCDGHRLWDKLYYTIVAREGAYGSDETVAWYTQAITDGQELIEDWHGKRLQSLTGRPPEYLFARFAWNIFPRVYQFLQTGQKRRLVVWGLDGTSTTREYTTAECRQFMEGQGNSRSVTSKKRARRVTSSQADDHEPLLSDEDDDVLSLSPDNSSCSGSDDSAVAGVPKERSMLSVTKNESEFGRISHEGPYENPYEERGRKRHRTAY
ncbi:Hypothetical protein R9X50_00100300 [Acrodontium crateriforme]|uniref:HNH nuclease domain-containing protein n=1 Tax=Acrodontium crateriforme TaxID=150365 RepID=A0AAQ3M4A4_9PEZI|nr:Hypothetical protein R9X50_00100300 [Acrodontium crateriforme]